MSTQSTSVTVGKSEITFETGKIARQAQGSCWVRCGETIVLSAITFSPTAKPGQDFFPLTVDYREKAYAAGRIPGNFFRREARPSEREILVCRLTDRPIRPLFPKGFLNEVLICQNVYSADNVNDPDVLSINAASAALHISELPWNGPIGAVRMGLIEGNLVVNPTVDELDTSDLDIVVAGTAEAILMVEGSAHQVPEDKMLEALDLAHTQIKHIVIAIEDLRKKAGKDKMTFTPATHDESVVKDVETLAADRMKAALAIAGKHARHDEINAIIAQTNETLKARYGDEKFAAAASAISATFGKLEKNLMRKSVIDTRKRIDGRSLDQVRPISIELGVLPRAHGSALFTRGETQTIVTTTLGTGRDEQRSDELIGDVFTRFFLHYNFPPWSVGEVRRISGPGRREIGHGKLAERALQGVIPPEENEAGEHFPYTVRIVSEVTESNGSSSMASVCGGSLSLMDAGVPIAAPVAGIAMGLIKEGDAACVLTDILGDEDHLGDMDFKVCGTAQGITAFQMDCKIAGVSRALMHEAMEQARRGRMHVLEKMNEAISAPRAELSPLAPKITTIKIPEDKIREVIGPGGRVIREIQAATGAQINIEDDGTVQIACADSAGTNAAVEMIQNLTATAEVGAIYHGTVTRLMNFGAFVNIVGAQEGLVHISELSLEHIGEVGDVVDVGDEIDVKVVEIDDMGRVNLSKIQADVELGRISQEEYESSKRSRPPRREGGGGGHRGGDRGGRGGDRGGRGGGHRGGRR